MYSVIVIINFDLKENVLTYTIDEAKNIMKEMIGRHVKHKYKEENLNDIVRQRYFISGVGSNRPTQNFIPVSTWGKLASISHNKLKKGASVHIHGKVYIQRQASKTIFEIVARDFQILDRR